MTQGGSEDFRVVGPSPELPTDGPIVGRHTTSTASLTTHATKALQCPRLPGLGSRVLQSRFPSRRVRRFY